MLTKKIILLALTLITFSAHSAPPSDGPDKTQACVGDQITFTPFTTTVSGYWDFGDGSPNSQITLSSVSHIYDSVGLFTIKFYYSSSLFKKYNVIVFDNPKPDFTITPSDVICSGNSIKFIDNSTYPNNPQSQKWYINGIYDSSGSSFSHIFNNSSQVKLKIIDDKGCSAEKDTFITVKNVVADFTSPLQVCQNELFTIQATTNTTTGTTLTYQWDFGNSAVPLTFTGKNPPNIKYTSPGQHIVKLKVQDKTFPSCPDSIIKTINVKPLPNPYFSYPKDSICSYPTTWFPNNVSDFNGVFEVEGNPIEFNANSTTGEINFNKYNVKTNYNYVIKHTVTQNGCSAFHKDTLIVFKSPLESVNLSINSFSMCPKDSLIVDVNYNGSLGPNTDLSLSVIGWAKVDTIKSNDEDLIKKDAVLPNSIFDKKSPYLTDTGLYVVAAGIFYDKNLTCLSTPAYFNIQIEPLPYINAGNDINLCEGNSDTLTGVGEGTLQWKQNNTPIGNPAKQTNIIQVSPTSTTDYELTAKSDFGCVNSKFVQVKVIPNTLHAGNDTSLCKEDTLFLRQFTAGYFWTHEDSLITDNFSIPSKSSYYILHHDTAICVFKDSIYVTVSENDSCSQNLTIYSGFTPNNDQINDQWIIKGIERFENRKVAIYNRWGTLVWNNNEYDNTTNVWKGQNNDGENLPEGVYYYIVTVDNKTYKGYIELSR